MESLGWVRGSFLLSVAGLKPPVRDTFDAAMKCRSSTKARRERAADGHLHVAGVCTTTGLHYTRQEVVDSINAGNVWRTSAGGFEATITTTSFCPAPG